MADINHLVEEASKNFEKAFHHLMEEFAKLQIGRASAALVETINVEAYGGSQPIKNLATISIPEVKTISIQPWDKSLIHAIEKAIVDAKIGVFPNNNGSSIILNIPPLTEERRKSLAKIVGKFAEETKIAVRNIRQSVHSALRQMKDAKEITEDEQHHGEKVLQLKVDDCNKKIDELSKKKEQDIMSI